MSDADREKWDVRHSANEAEPLPAPLPLLVEHPFLWLHAAGARALDVACGRGGTARFLARQGFEVDAIDISPVALAALRANTEGRVRTLEHDLDQGLPATLAAARYQLIVVSYFFAPPLLRALVEHVAVGGYLVVELPTVENLELGLSAPSRRFLIERGELLAFAGGLVVRLYREGRIGARVVAQLVAQRAAVGTTPTFV